MIAQRSLLTIGLAFMVTLAGCGAPGAPQAPSTGESTREGAPKRFTAAIRGFPKSISVTIDSAGSGSTAGINEVAELTNGGLTIMDGDGQVRPQLAEAVASLENGGWRLFPEGRMESTWKLRPNARWHDGTPVTSDDLVFTARIAQDRQLAIILDTAYDAVESVEALDATTVVVRWSRPYILAERIFGHNGATSVVPLPRHLLETAYDQDKAGFTNLPYWGESFVGAGPFKVQAFVPDSHLVLQRFDDYALGRPKIDEIEVRFVGDFNVMVANVLASAVDMTLGRGLSLEQGLEARNQWRDGRLDTALTAISALFPQFVNPTPAVVGDVRFRRALLQAIDRQQLADTLQAGLTPVAHSPLIPTDPHARAVDGSVVRYEYDPRRAAEMLEALGYSRGADGQLRDSFGEQLLVKIQTTNDDLREKTMPVIGDHWRQIGLAMEPVIIPRQLSSDRRLRAEFASFDFTRQPDDLTRYHSAQAPLLENGYRGSNRNRYRSVEYDALVDRYLVTIPVAQRLEILGQMVHHVTDQLVLMGIFYIVEPALISNRLQNIQPRSVADANHTWNGHEWDVP